MVLQANESQGVLLYFSVGPFSHGCTSFINSTYALYTEEHRHSLAGEQATTAEMTLIKAEVEVIVGCKAACSAQHTQAG